jgi:hypothetical protein
VEDFLVKGVMILGWIFFKKKCDAFKVHRGIPQIENLYVSYFTSKMLNSFYKIMAKRFVAEAI